jgi:hypothetical protein
MEPDPIPSNMLGLGGELPKSELPGLYVAEGLKLGFEFPNRPLMFMVGGGPEGVDERPNDFPGGGPAGVVLGPLRLERRPGDEGGVEEGTRNIFAVVLLSLRQRSGCRIHWQLDGASYFRRLYSRGASTSHQWRGISEMYREVVVVQLLS